VGEFTISLVFLINRKHIDEQTSEIVKYQNLSIDALAVNDKEAYHAANKMANEAFGKTFFSQIAMSAAFLWPIMFIMTWLQYRFSEVEFAILFTDYTVGCFAVFIPLYAASYMIFKRIKPMIPYFRRINAILDSYGQRTRKMKTLADLAPQNSKSA
jgi:membrane protein insertase Oxa1/YidC/SpoIIIJ